MSHTEKGNGDWVVSVNNSSMHSAVMLVFFTLLAYVLWKNHQVESAHSAWNGILLILVLMLWLACLFQLTGFVGYKFKAWKRHPKWATLFEEQRQDTQEPTEEQAEYPSKRRYFAE